MSRDDETALRASPADEDRLARLARDVADAFGVGLSVWSLGETASGVELAVDAYLGTGIERIAVSAPSVDAACAAIIARVASIERFRVGRTVIGPGSA